MSWCTCSHRRRQHATDERGRLGVGRCLGAGGTCTCGAYMEARLIGGETPTCHFCRRPAGATTMQIVDYQGAQVLVHVECWSSVGATP